MKDTYYKEVPKGAILQAGDFWPNNPDDKIMSADGWAGQELITSKLVLRPIQEIGWIPMSQRRPTLQDAYERYVYVLISEGKIKHACINSFYETRATHWLSTGNRPKAEAPIIKIKEGSGVERKVTINKDGSLDVGCAHVDKETFDTIVKLREKITAK